VPKIIKFRLCINLLQAKNVKWCHLIWPTLYNHLHRRGHRLIDYQPLAIILIIVVLFVRVLHCTILSIIFNNSISRFGISYSGKQAIEISIFSYDSIAVTIIMQKRGTRGRKILIFKTFAARPNFCPSAVPGYD